MLIKIEPLDTLFFRDGKPFTMGDDNWANGMFLPQPSVIYGALRSAYFSNNINDLKKAAEDDDPTKNLKIKGIYLFDSEENKFYLPLPMDCVQKKNANKKNDANILFMEKLDKIISSCPTEYALKGTEEVENINWGLIETDIFKNYLNLSEKNFSFLNLSDKIIIEPKIGIGKNNKTGTSEEGKLYRVGMNRLDNMQLLIDFEGLELPEGGLMKLGGESRAVHYEKSSCQKLDLNISINELTENKFKLYLSTPAIFEKNGWIPEWLNNKDLTYESNGFKIKLLTAAIGKPLSMGGFDMKKNKPKPMLKVVPSGSVYYFEIIKGDFKEAYEAFNNKAISVHPEQGYGLAFVGRIHKND